VGREPYWREEAVMPGETLYDTDFYAWSQEQAEMLRALARDTKSLPNALDIANIAEEIEGVGNSQLSAMASRVRLILAHLIKCVSQPDSDAVGHWRAEMVVWHDDLMADITRAMQAKIDMSLEWRRAVRQAGTSLAAHGVTLATGLPKPCPIALESLLVEELDFAALTALIEAARA
jgi:Domain of unknown function DUF29